MIRTIAPVAFLVAALSFSPLAHAITSPQRVAPDSEQGQALIAKIVKINRKIAEIQPVTPRSYNPPLAPLDSDRYVVRTLEGYVISTGRAPSWTGHTYSSRSPYEIKRILLDHRNDLVNRLDADPALRTQLLAVR